MDFQAKIGNAIKAAAGLENPPEIKLQIQQKEGFGDLSTNYAMLLAKPKKMNPRAIAEEIIDNVDWFSLGIEKAEIAGPGFINLWIDIKYYQSLVAEILDQGADFGKSSFGQGKRINVEFVSANPTGPLNVVSARAAAIGDSLVRVLRKAGFDASAEFYINDAGRQVNRLGASVLAHAKNEPVPEDGYHGDYVIDLAEKIFGGNPPSEADSDAIVGKQAADLNLEKHRQALKAFGVAFDEW